VALTFLSRYYQHHTSNRYDQYRLCLADGMRFRHFVAAA
jgi:hypothetical protein